MCSHDQNSWHLLRGFGVSISLRGLIMKLPRADLYTGLLGILLVHCCTASPRDGKYVEESCETSGVKGKCKLVLDCPLALESLKKKQMHNFKRCGFDGVTEIVCCPEVDTKSPKNKNRFTKRRCEQACDDLSSDIKNKIGLNIIGGINTRIEDFPHMVALGYETEEGIQWDCGASLISKRYLLTAAHCIANIKRLKPKIARMGVTLINDSNSQDYTITNITINPKYDSSTKHNDIALLKVDRDVVFSDQVYPACLYAENDDPKGLLVTGWGKTTISNEDDRSSVLQKALLVAVPLNECNSSYIARSTGTYTLVSTQLCANSNMSDACWGDSGGPLQIQNKAGSYSIVGVISYGAGCAGKLPGVYTRVSKYLDWIENIVWP